jgi:hypothetical protein
MQRVCELPREVRAKILMMAIETPTAAIMKAAIGVNYGIPGWWLRRVGYCDGYQKHLNLNAPCETLWARVLTRRWNGTLAWKWSQTNTFLNLTGKVHQRGVWTGIRSERALRMTLGRRKRIPCDDDKIALYKHWDGECRRLFVKLPDGSFKDTGAYFGDVLTEANIRLHDYRIKPMEWSAQMTWYFEHHWVDRNVQSHNDIIAARERIKESDEWRYSTDCR